MDRSLAPTIRISFSLLLIFAAGPLGIRPAVGQAVEALPLELEAKIPLGEISGRIDHLAFDSKRQRIFVAELENGSVGIVDPNRRRVVGTISGLKEPQGVAYVPSTDMLYVANGGNGSVRLFQAEDYAAAGQIDLGENADNVRVDAATDRVLVGYGGGALAVIDAGTRAKIAEVPLRAHPESFQLAPTSNRVFINLPQMREIAVVDLAINRQIATWPMNSGGNFAMTLDLEAARVLVAFRNPPGLGASSMRQGDAVGTAEACGDADDLFLDSQRHRVYISCGDGFVDVFAIRSDRYQRLAHIPTAAGARTSLFVPAMDRLFVAVPARERQPAELWVFRPAL